MELFLNITSSILDAFILTVYLFSVLGKLKKNTVLLYTFTLFAIEVILYFNQLWLSENPDSNLIQVMVTLISFLTTFMASLFFESKMLPRVLASILFQLLYIASESIFTSLIMTFQSDLEQVEDMDMLFATMAFGSIITMFFLIMCLRLIFKRNRKRYPVQFHIQLLSVPLITFVIMSLLHAHSFYETKHINTYIMLIFLLAAMNIINYVQIEWSSGFLSDRKRLQEMQLQFNYQRQKYEQLSESYRSGRRFLHDTKKHFFVMQEYLQNKQYDQLDSYIKKAFGDLENLYAKYNTGNLVIDSFMTSFDHMAEQKNIRFEAILSVDKSRIPMEDYDLCIVLGNLLDNALHACEIAAKKERFIRIVLETTKKDLFVIEAENTMDTSDKTASHGDNLEHGYGLMNIKQTLEKYHGIMGYSTGESFNLFIRVPIIDTVQRIIPSTPPSKSRIPHKTRVFRHTD